MFLEPLHRPVPISVETEVKRASLRLFIALVTCLLMVIASNAETNSSNCLDLVKPLDKKSKEVGFAGGIWGIFAKSSTLDGHSRDAVKLDSNINKLIETLRYLCDTKSGVPFNELASFVTQKIEELGEEPFKRKQVLLGKPEKDVEDWLVYSRIAQANKKRTLNLKKVKTSIQSAGVFINEYWKLFNDFRNKDAVDSILPATITLNREISDLMATDPYLALALFEDSQIPYWDVDENYGGS